MKLVKLSLLFILGCNCYQAVADEIANAAAATAVNQAVMIGTALFLRDQGFQPEIVTNPNGMTSVITSSPNTNSGADSYTVQNQQSAKNAFFSGS